MAEEETISWFGGVDWGSERHQVCLPDARGTWKGKARHPAWDDGPWVAGPRRAGPGIFSGSRCALGARWFAAAPDRWSGVDPRGAGVVGVATPVDNGGARVRGPRNRSASLCVGCDAQTHQFGALLRELR